LNTTRIQIRIRVAAKALYEGLTIDKRDDDNEEDSDSAPTSSTKTLGQLTDDGSRFLCACCPANIALPCTWSQLIDHFLAEKEWHNEKVTQAEAYERNPTQDMDTPSPASTSLSRSLSPTPSTGSSSTSEATRKLKVEGKGKGKGKEKPKVKAPAVPVVTTIANDHAVPRARLLSSDAKADEWKTEHANTDPKAFGCSICKRLEGMMTDRKDRGTEASILSHVQAKHGVSEEDAPRYIHEIPADPLGDLMYHYGMGGMPGYSDDGMEYGYDDVDDSDEEGFYDEEDIVPWPFSLFGMY